MNLIRRKALKACIIEFFAFSFVGFSLVLILFHAGMFAFPVIAFMWTFWGFNFFTFLFGIRVRLRYKLSFAFLNLLVVSLCIVFLLNSFEDTRNEMVLKISLIISAVVGVLYLLDLVFFIKNYWKPAKTEVLRLGVKNE